MPPGWPPALPGYLPASAEAIIISPHYYACHTYHFAIIATLPLLPVYYITPFYCHSLSLAAVINCIQASYVTLVSTPQHVTITIIDYCTILPASFTIIIPLNILNFFVISYNINIRLIIILPQNTSNIIARQILPRRPTCWLPSLVADKYYASQVISPGYQYAKY